MGYQESLVYIQPQDRFSQMIGLYKKAYDAGYYMDKGVEPLSIIILKDQILNIPKSTKLLWVVGARCFHNIPSIFSCSENEFDSCIIKIIPVEEIFIGLQDYRLRGINFNISEPTENTFMTRESIKEYVRR